jgi:coatomer protein complex subunit alpha (xenin)
VRKDVNGQFQTSLLLGDVNERVKVLEQCGQRTLAYLTAKTHGLEQEADRLAETTFGENSEPPNVNPNACLLKPPVPIAQHETNWPLLSISKGFFEGAIATRSQTAANTAANAAGAVTMPSSLLQVTNIDLSTAGKNWDDDVDLDLDEDGVKINEDGVGNKEGGEKGWDVDDGELDIPADLVIPTADQSDSTESGKNEK